jgi:hypothetical protein
VNVCPCPRAGSKPYAEGLYGTDRTLASRVQYNFSVYSGTVDPLSWCSAEIAHSLPIIAADLREMAHRRDLDAEVLAKQLNPARR